MNSSVIPYQQLKKLVDNGIVSVHKKDKANKNHIYDNIQPASIDLTLDEVGYRIQASFLPQKSDVDRYIKELKMYEIDLAKGGVLEKNAIYIVPLREVLKLPENIAGKTNPKSSIGRIDLFTRVVTDNNSRFEEIKPGYNGRLYLEITPRSFTVKVKAGMKLNQLRLFELKNGKDQNSGNDNNNGLENSFSQSNIFLTKKELIDLHNSSPLLYDKDKPVDTDDRHFTKDGLSMSIDLLGEGRETTKIFGYKSGRNSKVIDLDRLHEYHVSDFWIPLKATGKVEKIILEPEEFYIFASKEKIVVPPSHAAEMIEYDSGAGELRTHYAGFFDPGFGYNLKETKQQGAKAVMEIRAHEVPFVLCDGQILFKMKYEKMSELPKLLYGENLNSNYQSQGLKLAKYFYTDKPS